MNELNPPDVVGSLLADKHVDMADLQLIPGSHRDSAQELVETADEEFVLSPRFFSQALMLYTETQIVSHLWKEAASSNGRRQRKGIALDTSRGMGPAKETAQAILDWQVMADFKSRLAVASPVRSGARPMGDPEVDEIACQLRIKFPQGFQFYGIDKPLQTIQVL